MSSRLAALAPLIVCPRCQTDARSCQGDDTVGALVCDSCHTAYPWHDGVLDLGNVNEDPNVAEERVAVRRTERNAALGGINDEFEDLSRAEGALKEAILALPYGNNSRYYAEPGYFSNVHGVAIDPATHHVFVNDRNNHRIQVFDENGKYLYEWKIDADPSSLHLLYIGSGKTIWTYDRTTNKMVEWDLQGHLLYTWGSMGDFPGGLWGVHGMSVDQEGNLYVAEVDAGRVQKFHPKAGANPDFIVAKPIYSAWK